MGTLYEYAKDIVIQNLPLIMDKGSKVFDESKKKVLEYRIKQKINQHYRRIGQLIYKNKIKVNNSSIRRHLEIIAENYLDIQNNDNLIAKIDG